MSLFTTKNSERNELVRRLYERYGDEIFRFCLRQCRCRADAEDATQDVFVGAMKGFAGFRSEASHRTWLYRIALFTCRAMRKRSRTADVSLGDQRQAASHGSADETVEQIVFQQALDNLDEPLREAFTLVKVSGLTCQEAATVMRAPVGTVKFWIHRAVQALQLSVTDPSSARGPSLSTTTNKENEYAL